MAQVNVQTIDAAGFLEFNLPLIEGVIAEIGRRYRVRADALDEFRSLAFLKLVEQDFGVLRRFHGASSLRTYLAVVLQRVLLDYRNREWGRWRASAAASRLGPVAVRLERLVTRDGLSPGEAIACVGPEGNASPCVEFARTLKPRVPPRGTRARLGEEAIPDAPDPGPGPDAAIERREQAQRATSVRRIVRDALRALSSEDHLLITLRFRDGLTIADTARVLDLDPKPLYRRITRILAHLHAVLYTDELRGELARELSRQAWSDISGSGESGWWWQSNDMNGRGHTDRTDAREPVSGRGSARRVHRRAGASAIGAYRAASL